MRGVMERSTLLWDGAAIDLERTMVEPHRIRRDIFIGQHTGGHDLT